MGKRFDKKKNVTNFLNIKHQNGKLVYTLAFSQVF